MAVIKYRDSSSKELKKLEIPIPNEVSIGEDETKLGEDVELFIDESLEYGNEDYAFPVARQIFSSTEEPDDAIGKDGDIWFVYKIKEEP